MKKKCKHPDFWFDRTIAYCPYCKEEHMDSICNDCNKSACEITHGGRV